MLRCIECGAESQRGLNWEARIASLLMAPLALVFMTSLLPRALSARTSYRRRRFS
jgi:hypothetical protein